MKNTFPLHSNPSRRPALGNRRGIALVSVLAVLILLTVLVVAFLMRAQVARTSSANYRATTGTRLLADTVLNLVQAEINDATTYGSTSGTRYTWASQPGAIRVYDTSGGAATKIYRLYSAPSLTTTSISDLLDTSGNTTEIPSTWATDTAKYVDLNAPVSVTDPSNAANAFTIYPILDNRSPQNPGNPTNPTDPLNPAKCVQLPGFFVNPINTVAFPTAATTAWNPPVMPVQWLYVLQGGQIVAPDSSSSGGVATFTGSITPTGTNPIVGRIAYWTDDDTSKVNINTAGGSVSYRTDGPGNPMLVGDGLTGTAGVFFSTSKSTGASIMPQANAWPPAAWDVPRFAASWEDTKLFAADQPVQGEYQRYPGHPATTILYYILRSLGVSKTAGFTMPEIIYPPSNGDNPYAKSYSSGSGIDTQSGGALVWAHTSSLYGLFPRYNDNGGSQGGIANTTMTNPPSGITVKRNRLYTSLGELFYSAGPVSTGLYLNSPSDTSGIRLNNGTLNGATAPTAPYFTRQQIETGKFFMTAHSRAPEVTLFGTPRIAMWPIPDTAPSPTQGNPMAITALDKLIAFCSTTDQGSATPPTYYFQRYDAYSSTNDYNNEPRNQTLFGYLQQLTSSDIPGYGGHFSAKYGSSYVSSISSEIDQILTEMIDYIRCTNLNDHSWTNSAGTNPLPSSKATFAPKGEVFPLQITKNSKTSQGLGRLLTLSEIGLHIICTADGTNNLAALQSGATNTTKPPTSNTNPAYQTSYEGVSNTSTSVAYSPPVNVSGLPYKVSPVIGSACDPAYVSNLPEPQFLRLATLTITGTTVKLDLGSDGQPGVIVDLFGNTTNPTTPFPANYTLSKTGSYDSTGSNLDALTIGSKKLQAMLLFEPSSPMAGFDPIMATGGQGPDVNILVNSIEKIQIAGQNPFPSTTSSLAPGAPGFNGPGVNGNGFLNGRGTTGLTATGTAGIGWLNNGDSDVGGIFGFRFPMGSFGGSSTANASKSLRCNGWSGVGALAPETTTPTGTLSLNTLGGSTSSGTFTTGNSTATRWIPFTGATSPYRFVSNPFTVSGTTIQIGGTNAFNVSLTLPVTVSGSVTQVAYQTYKVAFPSISMPPPTLPAYGFTNRFTSSNNNTYTTFAPDWWNFDNRIGWCSEGGVFNALGGSGSNITASLGLGCVIRGDSAPPAGGWAALTGTLTSSGTWVSSSTNWTWTTTGTVNTNTTAYGDVVRTVIPKDGDYRLTMARASTANFTATVNATPSTSDSDFTTPPLYSTTTIPNTNMLLEPAGSNITAGVDLNGTLLNNIGTVIQAGSIRAKVPSTFSIAGTPYPNSPATPNPQTSWDWDNGMAGMPEGAYANKADEGDTYVLGTTPVTPYFQLGSQTSGNGILSYFTANRIVNSPVMFGSLPTGVAEGIPWRTLLFRPQMTVAQGGLRPNVSSPSLPKDYLLLDNFWMPVVQPYAISEPFSTAGKINMNYQILPFTHITRSTAVQAVLGSELVARVPLAASAAPGNNPTAIYNGGGANGPTVSTAEATLYASIKGMLPSGSQQVPARLPLNLSEVNGTLRQFRAKFTGGDLFRSPAEICDIYLVPRDSVDSTRYVDWYNPADPTDNSYADYRNPDSWYGSDFALVGDNVREHPYGDLYPRLTTKSNSYTVYYKVQVLKTPPTANQAQWNDATGVVTGEYRGSTSLERYLDPHNISVPDYATSFSSSTIDTYYQWRTVANNAFAP